MKLWKILGCLFQDSDLLAKGDKHIFSFVEKRGDLQTKPFPASRVTKQQPKNAPNNVREKEGERRLTN